jgi:hypothetical protein
MRAHYEAHSRACCWLPTLFPLVVSRRGNQKKRSVAGRWGRMGRLSERSAWVEKGGREEGKERGTRGETKGKETPASTRTCTQALTSPRRSPTLLAPPPLRSGRALAGRALAGVMKPFSGERMCWMSATLLGSRPVPVVVLLLCPEYTPSRGSTAGKGNTAHPI